MSELHSDPQSALPVQEDRSAVIASTSYRIAGYIAFSVAAIAFLPLLVQHFRDLWQAGEYQHVPLLLAAIAFLYWQRWPRGDDARDPTPKAGYGLLIGLLGLSGAALLRSPPAAMLAFIPAAMSGARWISGTTEPRTLRGAGWLLLLLVPLPYFLHAELVDSLKSWTTGVSGLVLDTLGVNHMVLGYTIAVPGRHFFVSDACSGVNSLFGMIALAMALAVWWRMPAPLTLAMIPATLVAVLAVNVVRIVIIVAAFTWQGADLTTGAAHHWLGVALLPLSLLLVVGMISWTHWALAPIALVADSPLSHIWDQLLHGVDAALIENPLPDGPPTHPPALLPPVPLDFVVSETSVVRRSPLEWLPVLALATTALVGQRWLSHGRQLAETHLQRMDAVSAESLPESLDSWQQADFQQVERRQDDPQGSRSRSWLYRHTDADRSLIVSVDYPFPGWHELPMCYRGSGWQIEERKIIGGHGRPYLVRTTLRDGRGAPAYLWFTCVDATGQTLEPPQQNWIATLRNQVRIALNQFGTDTTTRQVQMLAPGGQSVSDKELLKLEQRFSELIPKVAPDLTKDPSQMFLRSVLPQ